MKAKSMIFLISFLILLSVFVISNRADAVSCSGNNRFWVGGTGLWSNILMWSSSSGGLGGSSVPTINDPVIFDANSGSGTVTLDINALSCNVTATSTTITTISMGSQTWNISGDITDLQGKITAGTSILELSGSVTQTIGPQSGTNLNLATIKISGIGTKVFNQRIVPSGWVQTISSEIDISPSTNGVLVGFFPIFTLLDAGSNNILTIRSTSNGNRWYFEPQVSTMSFRRVDIKDAGITVSTIRVFATDVSNTDSGNNDAKLQFIPRSSIVEENSTWFNSNTLDYGPHIVRNSIGNIIVIIPDGSSVNNGKLSVRYSINNGLNWSVRIPLMTPSADGTGILDSSIGSGWEIFAFVHSNILSLVGHKLISGATHVFYTKIDITNITDIATFSNWKSASGVPADFQGMAINGKGYDDLGSYIDPGVVMTVNGDIYIGLGCGSCSSKVAKWTGTSWAYATLDFSGNNPEDLVLVYDDPSGTIYLFAHILLSAREQIVVKRCLVVDVCVLGANWKGINGGLYDIVISNSSGSFGFPHPVVDSLGTVHIIAGSKFLISGFLRLFHNYLVLGNTTWNNGQTLDSAGTEINSGLSYPDRTRLFDSDRYWVGTGLVGDVYLVYRDQQTTRSGPSIWSNFVWGPQTYTIAGNSRSGTLRERAGINIMDIMTVSISGQIEAIQYQGITSTMGNVPWWDTTTFVLPSNISVVGWLLGIIALVLFIFGAWKFPLAIFLSGFATIFLALQLYSETHSIIISAFMWLLAIFVILFGVFIVIKEEGRFG